jgi:phage terminase large subunit-like protein
MTDDIEYGPDPNQIRRHQKKMLTEKEYRQKYRRIDFYRPSPKQLDFHNAPSHITELRLIAATQSGKSFSSMANEAMDCTGDYMPWFKGKKFLEKRSIIRPHEYMSWVICTSHQVQKQTLQLVLLGNLDDPNGMGTGMTPLDSIIGRPVFQRGMANVCESFTVRRVTGGTGHVGFRSMEQAVSAFAGASLDQIRWDEPGPINLYLEALARLTAVSGSRAVVTLTPTEGRDQLWMRFEEPSKHRMTMRMTLHDATHLSKEQIQEIIDRTPPQDRPMRIYGEPAQGSGSVYETPEANIVHERELPSFNQPWLKWAWATDITHGGSASAFAAVLSAYDPHTDVLWIVDTVKLKGANIPTQVAALKQTNFGDVVVLYPRDSQQPGDAMTGETLASLYKRAGLVMAPKFVTDDRGKSPGLEDGVANVATRLATGKLKVASWCREWFDEYRAYHRKDRRIVQEFNDLMDATRVLVTGIKQMRHLPEEGSAYRGVLVWSSRDGAPRGNRGPYDWDKGNRIFGDYSE